MTAGELRYYITKNCYYDEDKKGLCWRKNDKLIGSISRGYRVVKIKGKTYPVHHLVWLLFHKELPEQFIDHINHDRLDNRITNLREVTPQENMRNQSLSKANTSGFTGVRFHKDSGKYYAYIYIDGFEKSLGYFDTKEEAILARIKANKEYGFHENHGLPEGVSLEEFQDSVVESLLEQAAETIEEKFSDNEEEEEASLPSIHNITPVDMDEANLEYEPPKNTVPLSLEEHYIAEAYASGFSPQAIANKTGMSKAEVQRILNRKQVSEFVNELIKVQMNVVKEGRLRLMNRIINDKIALIERSGGNFGLHTKKDLPDLLMMLDSMQKEQEKKSLGTTEDTYLTIINQVLKT